MATNQTSFSIYRFQLVPISTTVQTKLFEQQLNYGELIQAKNSILSDVISAPDTMFRGRTYDATTRIEVNNGEDIVMKVAREKTVKIHKDFITTKHPDYPFVTVYLDNRPERQFIFIENNPAVFSDSATVVNIIKLALNTRLAKYNLVIYIERLFNEGEFWKTLKRYENRITSIQFEFIKPNMANISGAIKRTFDQLESTTNSHKTNLGLHAPKKGVLENIDPSNEVLSDVVNYQAQGGGPPPTIKVKGLRRKIKTKMAEKSFSIDEYEGDVAGFIEVMKKIENAI